MDSEWILFGRHVMIAVKQNRGKGGSREAQRRGKRQTEDTRQTGRETPAVASPAVITVLTFK